MIVNEDAFTDNNLRKAGYESNPLDDGSLDDYQVFRVPMTSMTRARHRGDRGHQAAPRRQRTKNLFALGLVSWMYGRPTEPTIAWMEKKFAKKPGDPRRQPRRLPGRLQLRRDGRARWRSHYEVEPAPARRPATTATSTAPRRWRWG